MCPGYHCTNLTDFALNDPARNDDDDDDDDVLSSAFFSKPFTPIRPSPSMPFPVVENGSASLSGTGTALLLPRGVLFPAPAAAALTKVVV